MKSYNQTLNEIKQEVIKNILIDIDNYKGSDLESLFFDLFNSDYYIIGTYQAKEWLTEKDVFNCIEIVTEWEKDVFGEIQSDLYNPEKLASLVVYSVADNLMNDLCYELIIERDAELNNTIIERIKAELI